MSEGDPSKDKDMDMNPWENYSDLKRPKQCSIYRVGPAPKQEWEIEQGGKSSEKDHLGNLDSTEILAPEEEEDREKQLATEEWKAKITSSVSASSRAIVLYFSRMAKEDNNEKMDYHFLNALLTSGGSVNVSDKFGQTVMHEVARNWNTDVAKFLISFGGDMNHADKWGRTPLHLAAATDHAEMVDYLIRNGANPRSKTAGEGQQVIHYAAKFNSVATLKVLVEHKVKFTVKDYKGRTPLFLAAEMARVEAVRYLLDLGDRVGVFDDTGMSAIATMIEKMPQVACDALDQFQITDYGKRKEYFFLNYLESNPITWWKERREAKLTCDSEEGLSKAELREQVRSKCPTSALEIAVKHNELKVIMHPAMQELIKTKWKLFGRLGASMAFTIHFIYVCLWTVLAITLPRDADYYTQKHGRLYWRLPLEILSVLMTFYFILMEIWTSKISYRNSQTFYSWRTRQIGRDLEHCHPRWVQEKDFLQSELKSLQSEGGGTFLNASRLLEFPTYLSVIFVIATRLLNVYSRTKGSKDLHERALTFSLIFIYLHFLKSCKPFPSLGIFITMMGYAIQETVNFMGIFLIFTLPYTIGFWMIFAGEVEQNDPMFNKLEEEAEGENGGANVGWVYFHDIMFFSWQVTLNVFFDKRTVMMDRLMAQLMIGSFYFASTLLLFNMYIGLLTETFYKVYDNATAYASIEQATTILNIEKVLSFEKKYRVLDYIHDNCDPCETDMEEDEAGVTEEELWDQAIRVIFRRFEYFYDFMTGADKKPVKKPTIQEEEIRKYKQSKEEYDLYNGVILRDKEIHSLRLDIFQLQCQFMKLIDPTMTLPEKPKHDTLPDVPPIPEPIKPASLKKNLPASPTKPALKSPESKPNEKLKTKRVSIDTNQREYPPEVDEDKEEEEEESESEEDERSEGESESSSSSSDDDSDGGSSVYLLNDDLSEQLNWIYPEDYYKGLLAIIEGNCHSVSSADRDARSLGRSRDHLRDSEEKLSNRGKYRKTTRFSEPTDDRWASNPSLGAHAPDGDISLGSTYPSMISLQSIPSRFQSTNSLQSVASGNEQNQSVQREDNALFRTIMNIKTSKIKYHMEPKAETLDRILSMINEEESILSKENADRDRDSSDKYSPRQDEF